MSRKTSPLASSSKSNLVDSAEPVNPGRARRKRLVKARTISTRGLLQVSESSERRLEAPPHALDSEGRPQTRAECQGSVRPCPYVSCRHHLYLEVSPTTGSLKLNFPDLEVWELVESCALDVADRGAQSTEVIGGLLNLTPERARQLEQQALLGVLSSLQAESAA